MFVIFIKSRFDELFCYILPLLKAKEIALCVVASETSQTDIIDGITQ
jgi:hypothetical protein